MHSMKSFISVRILLALLFLPVLSHAQQTEINKITKIDEIARKLISNSILPE